MVEKRLRKSISAVKQTPIKKRTDLVPTGSTLLNLRLSGTPYGGYRIGRITNIIGDWHAGKTWLFWQSMAEVVRDKRFDNYSIFYDGAEGAVDIPVVDLFSKKILRVSTKKKSISLEGFFDNIDKLIDKEKPFIYCLDSLDSLFANEQLNKTSAEVGKREIPSEPRVFNSILRRVHEGIDRTESVLFIISQTRKKIGIVFGSPQRRAGGDALHFHSWHELWLAVRGQLTKKVRGKDRNAGITIKIRIDKNKVTGRRSTLELPLYTDLGIDETGSLVNWLVTEEKIWKTFKGNAEEDVNSERKKKKVTVIKTPYGDMSYEELISYIEDNDLERELRDLVIDEWAKIESEMKTNRKKRY